MTAAEKPGTTLMGDKMCCLPYQSINEGGQKPILKIGYIIYIFHIVTISELLKRKSIWQTSNYTMPMAKYIRTAILA
jgi:hypothetical protein